MDFKEQDNLSLCAHTLHDLYRTPVTTVMMMGVVIMGVFIIGVVMGVAMGVSVMCT